MTMRTFMNNQAIAIETYTQLDSGLGYSPWRMLREIAQDYARLEWGEKKAIEFSDVIEMYVGISIYEASQKDERRNRFYIALIALRTHIFFSRLRDLNGLRKTLTKVIKEI